MANDGKLEDKLVDEIKILRDRHGCRKNINGAEKLTKIMGCAGESDKDKTLYLIALINEFFKDAEQADLLLLSLNLLKGYYDIKSVNERRIQYYHDYLSHENLTERNIANTLSKRENKIITQLVKQIIAASENDTLKDIIKDIPKEFKLPSPRYRKNVSPSNLTEENDLSDKGESAVESETKKIEVVIRKSPIIPEDEIVNGTLLIVANNEDSITTQNEMQSEVLTLPDQPLISPETYELMKKGLSNPKKHLESIKSMREGFTRPLSL